MNLQMKKVLALPFFSKILHEAVVITKFIRLHDKPQARFLELQKNNPQQAQHASAVPVATRWYSHGNCITSVIENKDIICKILRIKKLLQGIDEDEVDEAKRLVKRRGFWTRGALILKLLAPITKCMGDFEKDSCCLSSIYEGFLWLKRHDIYTTSTPGIPRYIQNTILEFIDERWKFIHTDTIDITYLLDHTKQTSSFQGEDKMNQVTQLVGIAERIYPPEKICSVREEISTFLARKRNFSPELHGETLAMSPLRY